MPTPDSDKSVHKTSVYFTVGHSWMFDTSITQQMQILGKQLPRMSQLKPHFFPEIFLLK